MRKVEFSVGLSGYLQIQQILRVNCSKQSSNADSGSATPFYDGDTALFAAVNLIQQVG